MKRISTLLIVLAAIMLAASVGLAQIGWTGHVIDADAPTARCVYPVDINNDGDIDVIGGNADEINLYDNNGYQIFREFNISPYFQYAMSVSAIDLDSDGDMDILGAGYYEDHLGWWEQVSAGVFTYHFLAFFNSAYGIAGVDFDNDNDIDIVAASASDNKISWFENDGNEFFTEHIAGADLSSARYAYAIDVDNDNDLDIVGCTYTADEVFWLCNDGTNLNFTKNVVGAMDGAYCVKAADLDNDNDVDIFAVGYSSNTVEVYVNDGNQNFTVNVIGSGINRPRTLDAADLDGDSDVDIIVGAYSDNMLIYYENDGMNFTQRIIGDCSYPYCVFASDMDSDGDTDVVAASYYGGVVWFESDLGGAHPLSFTITPQSTTIEIPPAGGSFQYDIQIINASTQETFVLDGWADITLPPWYSRPLFFRENLSVPPQANFTRTLTQYIPASAMPGHYTYNGYVRDHTSWQVYGTDSFSFVKLQGTDEASHNMGWALIGWDDESTASTQTPLEYSLSSPYPNPFNPVTNLTYSLPEASEVSIVVFNVEGKEIARLVDGWKNAGVHQVSFEAGSFSSGIYFAKMSAGTFNQTQKLLLTK